MARLYLDVIWPRLIAAADEMANSRVYGGIHFRFDNVAGKQIGADVAGYILENYLEPRRPSAFAAPERSAPIATSPFHSSASLDAAVSGEDLQKFIDAMEETALA